jgi:hypothetical protein
LRSHWFEGDTTRVISRDGELIWDSHQDGASERRGVREYDDEPARDTREIVLDDEEALNLMQGWWNGQNDPLYAIYSMGGAHEAWVFQDALDNLDYEIGRVKMLGNGRYRLGKGTFSQEEIDELHTMRDAIAEALESATGKTVSNPWIKPVRESGTGRVLEAREAHLVKANVWVPPELSKEGIRERDLEILLHGMGEHSGGRVPRAGDNVVYDKAYQSLVSGGYIVRKQKTQGLSSFGDYYVLTDKGADVVRRYRLAVRKIGTPSTREGNRVRDYEVIDGRTDRRQAGPFKHRHEADQHRGPGDVVRFVPSRSPREAQEMRRRGSAKKTAPRRNFRVSKGVARRTRKKK